MTFLPRIALLFTFAISVQANCPTGWSAYKDRCYLEVREALNFVKAQAACEVREGNLASFPDKESIAFVKRNLNLAKGEYWIGLRSEDWRKTPLYWNDGEEVSYTNWNEGEPNGPTWEKCAEMSTTIMKWVDIHCEHRRWFICSKNEDANPTVHCPTGWKAYKEHCYLEVREHKNFAEAQAACEVRNGDLASFPNAGSIAFAKDHLNLANGAYWIGITSKDWRKKPLHWNDGTEVSHANWNNGEPNGPGITECAEMYTPSMRWNDDWCRHEKWFICSHLSENKPPVKCPTAWKAYEDRCYIEVREANNFAEAQAACESRMGDLATFPDARSIAFVKDNLNLANGEYWIGLSSEDWRKKPLHWNDGEEVSFTNWQDGEPNAPGFEKCAEMNTPAMMWNDKQCAERRWLICSKKPEDCDEDVEEFNAEILNFNEDIFDLNEENDELKNENTVLEDDNSQLASENSNYKRQIETLTANIENLEGEVSAFEDENAALTLDNTSQKEEIANLNKSNAKQAEEIVNLNLNNSKQAEAIANLKTKNSKQAEENANLSADNSKQAEEIANLNTKSSKQAEEIAKLNANNSKQAEEISQLKTQLSDTESKLEECEGKEKVLPGWHAADNEMQYIVTNKRLNFNDSEQFCESIGGQLASKGMRDLDLRRSVLDTFALKTAWIGLYDAEGDLEFVWIDGEEGTDDNIYWVPNQPSRSEKEQCGVVIRSLRYKTKGTDCEKKFAAVCEKTI